MSAQLFRNTLSLLLTCVLATGCIGYGGNKDSIPRNYKSIDVSNIPNATPKVEPKSKYGNPSSYVVMGKRYYVLNTAKGYKQRGIASWYGTKFHKQRTSSGETYNMFGMTAANKVLPLPTYVRVTNLENGKWVIVKVNDRGPFHENRIIDLSFAAAKKLNMLKTGTAKVEVEAINPRSPDSLNPPVTAPKVYSFESHQIYLQLGVFSTRDTAQHLADTLKRYTTNSIRIVMANNGSRNLYKVQVGPIKDVHTADALTKTFERNGLGQAFALVK